MRESTIKKAIEVIKYAIANNISVWEASVKNGFANSYVKNIKAVVYEKYEDGTLDDDLFDMFNGPYLEYIESRENNKNTETSDEIIETKDKPVKLPKISANSKTSVEVKGDKSVVEYTSGSNYPENHIKTLESLLSECKVDKEIWSVKDHIVNKWDVTSWKRGFAETIQNYQVKARLERIVENVRVLSAAEVFKDLSKNYQPPLLDWTPTTKKKYNENNLLEVSIFDLHIGKLAWGGETGENYDTKIASERFMYSINKLIERANNFEFSRILFPVGSDFFNSDNIFNTTTKGTPQDEDLRWQKTFRVGSKLLVDGIELLKQTGVPVDVIVIPGNHDFERSFYLGEFLSAWYYNDPMVNINNNASPRKYYVFGNVLLGFTHGSEEKESSLPMIMANDMDSKKYWSKTLFHEWHVGHIHRKRNMNYTVLDKNRMLNEDLGVTIRYLSSLTGNEEWHHKKGFVGQVKAADAFIWNDEFGLIAHLNSNLIIEEYKE